MAEEENKSKVPQIVAGSLAVFTSALVGSLFGVAGTTVGLAFGSLVSGLAAEIYERPLTKAHNTLKSKLKKKDESAPPSSHDVKITEKSKYGDTRFFTGVLIDEPPKPHRKFNAQWAIIVAVLTFVIGFGSITIIEFAKGSPISGGNSGTTLSGLLGNPIKTKPETTTEHPEWTTTEVVPTTTVTPSFTETTTPSITSTPETSSSLPTTSSSGAAITTDTAPQITTTQNVSIAPQIQPTK
jgi:hypothetical protein